jgi:Tfp pilus assembly protein PilP
MRIAPVFRGPVPALLAALVSGTVAFAQAPAAPGKAPAPADVKAEAPPAVAAPSAEPPTAPAYSYEVRGRRDPFRSLLLRRQDDKDRNKPPGIAGMLVEELELQGTIRSKGSWIAMMRGGDNRSYLVKKGTTVFDGEVIEITPTEIVFRQNVNDPTNPKPFRDVTKSLALQQKP